VKKSIDAAQDDATTSAGCTWKQTMRGETARIIYKHGCDMM